MNGLHWDASVGLFSDEVVGYGNKHLYSPRMAVTKEKYKLINNKQHTHNKRYVQLQQTTKMSESIIWIIVFDTAVIPAPIDLKTLLFQRSFTY